MWDLNQLSSVTGQSQSVTTNVYAPIQWLRTAVCVRPDIMSYPLSLDNLYQLNASAYAPFQWLRITLSVRPTWEDPVCFKYGLSMFWKPNNHNCQASLKLTPLYLEVLNSYLAHRWDCYGFCEFFQANARILSQTTPWLCPLILFPNSLFTNCPISDVIQSGLLKALLKKTNNDFQIPSYLVELLQCLDLQCCHEK